VESCTFVGNSTAGTGGGIDGNDSTTLVNCILWGNTAGGAPQIDGPATVTYSCIQGGFTGTGNIDDDPLFVPGPFGCYYLSQTASGQAEQSPCVDAGDPTSPLIDGTTRSDEVPDTSTPDMGYHYPVSGLALMMGDYDRDGDADLADFAEVQSCFTGGGPTDVSACCRIFDFEPDEDVDLDDYTAFYVVLSGP
jgi:hypothetical protein